MIFTSFRDDSFSKLVVALATVSSLWLQTSLSYAGDSGSRVHRIEIRAFSYIPAKLTVQAGDSVLWINHDIVPHTATASDHSWDSGEIQPQQSKLVVFDQVLDSSYFCVYHPTMTANIEITVQD